MPLERDDAVRRWSEAIARVEVLEPWLTESHWDEHYWDDVATLVVELLGAETDRDRAREVLAAALQEAFPEVPLRSDNGLYRDNLLARVDLIVTGALGQPDAP